MTSLVAYVPGTAFFADGSGTGAMRLSYCYPTPERITEGVRRLAGVVNAEADLVRIFGTAHSRRRGVESPGPETV